MVKSHKLFILVIFTILTFSTTRPALADGIVIPEPPPCPLDAPCPPPPFPRPISQLEIRFHHVTVTIEDQIAITRINQVFYNPNDWSVEGTYIFPLPAGAAVNDFKLWMDGEPIQGQVLDADQARKTYQEIVSQLKDPALLEYIGQGAVQASLFPIAPNAERQIQLEYTQVLTAENGLIGYTYPLNTEKFSVTPLESVSITVNIISQQPIRAIYSPSHPVDVIKTSQGEFTVSYEASQVLPDKDFELFFSVGETQAMHLFTYRDAQDPLDSDGFFLMLLAPQPITDNISIPKDLLLILDRSGSMEGEKFRQAQDALHYILENLNPNDRFYLSAFSSGLDNFARGLRPATDAPQALAWVDQLSAQGSTDINRALLEAASYVNSERPTYLIFLTDGLPTEGVVDSNQILTNFAQSAPKNLRLFPFGVGYDVDTFLLDTLAQDFNGLSTYVQPGEPLDEILSQFYSRISTPVLTDLKIDVEGVTIYDLYPSPIPDLFAGSQIILTGRYKTGGVASVTIQGKVGTDSQRFKYQDLSFDETSSLDASTKSSIPRLWATRKIGYLLNLVRLEGPSKETIDQIVQLSIRYGIITPYTSYLVTEPLPLGMESQERIAGEAYGQALAAPTEITGPNAVEKAADQGELSRAEVAASVPMDAGQKIRMVGSKTFVLQDNIWIDTAYDPNNITTQKVAFLSEDYFKLAESRTDIAAAFALGERVIVMVGSRAYEVLPENSLVPAVTLPPTELTPVPTPTLIPQEPETSSTSATAQSPLAPGLCPAFLLPLAALLFFAIRRR